MSKKKAINHLNHRRFAFIQEFLKHPLQIGSIIPSSRFLEQRIVKAADIASADVVVELGPGTGGTTRALLRAMPAHARLLCIELNPSFHALLGRINDERLITHLGSARDLRKILAMYNLDAPNVVVSGIPFSTMSHSAGTEIIETISSVLAPKGRFVAYQARDRVAILCRPILGTGQSVTELLNIPPMRIYQWQKHFA
ncbi:class I SAM-dependent methyltransferase [Sulfuriflexus sp.]|uniref:class I SAM-dependent methyltransferase n=1 Tax=Sulfuriflexus sp. TaxID=2015443 RepID=UPI0028CCC9BA|nr:rRNA adenine N-6-methyltransferase family protein [Sulfuriflexus sp.]MDT8403600.1 methyltransferase type 12 [Sulfuriflexus sp.]